MKLTKRVVEAAEPRGRDYFLWDDDLPGFGCRVFSSGKRSYLVQYRAAGRTRRVTIGLHGHLTAEEARKEAKGLLGEVAKGGNPADTRALDRAAITVADLCHRYLEAAEKGLILGKRKRPKKVTTLATDRGRIERHIKPLLGTRRVIDLTSADVTRFMREVATGKTKADVKTGKRGRAIVEGGRGTATRTVGLLGGILSFAVSEGIRADNPARGVTRFADGKRRVVLKPGQYRNLGRALELAGQNGENPKAIAGVWLIALTGCRLAEVAKLRKREADRAGGCFRFADTKEDESIRAIGKRAFDVIDGLEASELTEFVLPGDRGSGHYTALPKAWLRIRQLSNSSDCEKEHHLGNLTLHGLRHAFASVANELGYTEATRAALLGHAGINSQTGDYTHHLDSVLIAAADRVSSKIRAMINGHEAEVIDLPPPAGRVGAR
jgi:integrase